MTILRRALTVALVSIAVLHLALEYACCQEPKDNTVDRDEEIYGKYTIGPKSSTPLDIAVTEFNDKASDHAFNSDQPGRQRELTEGDTPQSLTVEELLAAIKNRDRTKDPQPERTSQLFESILNTKHLPPHSVLGFRDGWVALTEEDGRERRTWNIHLKT
ncbi:MAG TPA: hypothetical protein VGN12_03265 [Pirellulales bacterium]|jgi:hypothetical protein